MAVDLADYVDSLKREIQPPGSDLFAGVSDAQWVGYLADAFWEARLDGFLEGYTTDEGATSGDVSIVPVGAGADIDQRWIALIVLYAAVKILRNRILNMSTTFRAKAGPVEFEQQNSATMLAEMLKQLKATKDRIVEELDAAEETGVLVLDAYSTRLYSPLSYFGGPELTS
jgi:hypothetical protein